MNFSYTEPGRLESPEGYAIIRVAGTGEAGRWEIHYRGGRLAPPWVPNAGFDGSLREARRHAEAHHRYTLANPEP